jgi:hypothetical protein
MDVGNYDPIPDGLKYAWKPTGAIGSGDTDNYGTVYKSNSAYKSTIYNNAIDRVTVTDEFGKIYLLTMSILDELCKMNQWITNIRTINGGGC